MAESPVYIAQGSPASTSMPVDVIERASPDITTVTTADPSTGTALAVTNTAKFPQSGSFKVMVGVGTTTPEIMLVTAGAGTNSWTVTRGLDGTTNVAHTSGVTVALIVGVQRVEPVVGGKQVSYRGRAATFRTPGRAGTTGQKILAIHNATGSAVKVDITKIFVDVVQTAAAGIAPTVIPPVIRAWKFTAVPTNGSSITKVPEDSNLSSNSSVTLWQDASADGTNSTTALTITLPAGTVVTEEYKPRMLVVGTSASTYYEPFDRTEFFDEDDEIITLNALEGLAVFLDYTVATANPTTDMWVTGVRWIEYTLAQ